MSQKDDTISRQAAIKALGDEPEVWSGNDEYAQGLNNQWHYDVNALKAVPSAEPETTTMTVGRTKGEITMWYECDNCGEPVDQSDNYCRNCGRKFRKDE